MWGSCFHLTLGNALIGLLEGWLLHRIFHTARLGRTIAIMIAANYLSAWLGTGLISLANMDVCARLARHITVYNAFAFEIAAGIVLFALTIVCEWPLCTLALSPGERRWKRGLRASGAAQAASYAILIPYYVLVSYSFLTPWSGVSLASPIEIAAQPRSVWIYYIGLDDGDIYRIRPDGSQRTPVITTQVKDPAPRLCAAPNADGTTFDLCVQPFWRFAPGRPVLCSFAGVDTVPEDQWEAVSEKGGDTYEPFAVDLRPTAQRTGTVRAGSWPAVGLVIDDYRQHLGLETPVIHTWQSRIATILPGDQVVYELGDQIVLLDLKSMRLALIPLGRGPLAVLDTPQAASGTQGREATSPPAGP
jgi:hypothetical protein